MNYLVKAATRELLIKLYLQLGEAREEIMGSGCNPLNNKDINTIMIEECLFYGQNYSDFAYKDYIYLFIVDESDLFIVLSKLHIDTLNNTYPIF